MIRLAPITRNDWDRVKHIAVLPEQVVFCGTIDQHFAMDEPDCDFHIILRDECAVGFFKIDRAYGAREYAQPGDLGVRGVMIDAAEQGKGSGKAAMMALPAYVANAYPKASTLALTVNQSNPGARAVYLAAGFVDTGELYLGGQNGPQHVLRIHLRG